MITRIISGGETGVDRAGLDAAIALFTELGMPFWAARAEAERAEDPG